MKSGDKLDTIEKRLQAHREFAEVCSDPKPPFKKGDWLVTRPNSYPEFIPYQLHQATEDPQINIACGTHWSYKARTVFEGGKAISEMDAGHFTKATKADLYAERDRLHKEAAALQERATQLHLAAEGLS